MPLDNLQKAILTVLSKNRTPQSVFAGGSVLNRHTYRLSDDQDIFHAEGADLLAIAQQDVAALRDAGFHVERSKQYEGFIEALVGSQDGRTRVQWVEAGSWHFFTPVPDPEYGYRLHTADLAINKVLAAGGRREIRDFVDLALIHEHIMPLSQAIWAAPGKDENWSPVSLVEQIARKNNFHQTDLDEALVTLIPLSATEIGAKIRKALDDARESFTKWPDDTAGSLLVDDQGRALGDPSAAGRPGTHLIRPKRGGTWPSGPDIDHALIDGLVRRFGRDGSKLIEMDMQDSRGLIEGATQLALTRQAIREIAEFTGLTYKREELEKNLAKLVQDLPHAERALLTTQENQVIDRSVQRGKGIGR